MSENEPRTPLIKALPNGPLRVEGDVRLVTKLAAKTGDGEPIAWVTGPAIETRQVYSLCRCGQSSSKPFCDGTHNSVGFQPEETAGGTYDGRAKTYAGTGVVVKDDRSICTHAGFCGTAATNVWKMVGNSEATDTRSLMIAMIERCPSGALTYAIEGVEGDTEQDLAVQIAVIADGPLLATGRIPVRRADGTDLELRNRVTLCRCGASKNKPLCDGTHAEIGFKG